MSRVSENASAGNKFSPAFIARRTAFGFNFRTEFGLAWIFRAQIRSSLRRFRSVAAALFFSSAERKGIWKSAGKTGDIASCDGKNLKDSLGSIETRWEGALALLTVISASAGFIRNWSYDCILLPSSYV